MSDIRFLNIDDLEFVRWDAAFPDDQKPPLDRFGADVAIVGQKLGAQKLGYNVTSVDPGKAAYPLHNHRVNEEMFLILEGEGELRIGNSVSRVKSGDIIACPPGGPETAHQLRNVSTGPLKFLGISTMLDVDVVEYPNSGKVGYRTKGVSLDGSTTVLRGLANVANQPGYWDGE